jgi:hypothetical protein
MSRTMRLWRRYVERKRIAWLPETKTYSLSANTVAL